MTVGRDPLRSGPASTSGDPGSPSASPSDQIDLFVPGRLCLLGEHSDWSGAMRVTNPQIQRGQNIVAGINYGLYARVARLREPVLRVRSTSHDGIVREQEFALDDEDLLGRVARQGGFFSYAAGVAYKVSTEFRVGGLFVDNYRTTLPLKKGLSSSAAFCVLLARAFNLTYHLNLSERGEMAIAFEGERLTPSSCGKMDQCVAFGTVPVIMMYDGNLLKVTPARLSGSFYIVLVDLKASKDTVEILSSLQRAYPFPRDEQDRNLHELFGDVNLKITDQAVSCLENGDAEGLGKLMMRAQDEFDSKAGPLCPSQLGAKGSPVLHRVLQHHTIQNLIWGGKGVGSQGDGTCQLLCKDSEAQDKVCQALENELGLECLKVTLKQQQEE
jgi:galactokinase